MIQSVSSSNQLANLFAFGLRSFWQVQVISVETVRMFDESNSILFVRVP